LVDDLKFVTL